MKGALLIPAMLLASTLFGVGRLSAQDLEIEYDLLTGKSSFYKIYESGTRTQVYDGDVGVGHGDRITVTVKNMNSSIYTFTAEGRERLFDVPNAKVDLTKVLNDALKPAGKVNEGGGGDPSTKKPVVNKSNGPVPFGNTDAAKALASLAERSDRLIDVRKEFIKSADLFIASVSSQVAIMAPLPGSLGELSSNRGYTCEEIGMKARMLIAAVIDPTGSNAPTEKEILNFARKTYDDLMSKYQAAADAYTTLTIEQAEAKRLIDQSTTDNVISVRSTDVGAIEAAVAEQFDWKPLAEERWRQVQSLADSVRKYWMSFSLGVISMLREMESLRCERSFDIPATGDLMNVTIKVTDHGTSAERADGRGIREIAPQTHTIPVVGGWKFNGSGGFGLCWFPNNQREFFVDSGTIGSTAPRGGSLYTVALAHGYYRSHGWVTTGATAGVAVATGDPHHVAFLVGPSVILGKEQRIVGTLGVVYGQVTRLANDRKVGETFVNTDGVELTTTGWAWGMMIGVSYNLFSTGD